MPLSHYEILSVPQNATAAEIRRAYRREALVWHPDRNPVGRDAHRRFLAIQNAYEVLTDAGRRTAYDGLLAARAARRAALDSSPRPNHVYPAWLRDLLYPEPLYEPIIDRKKFATGLPLTKILVVAVIVFVVGVIVGKLLSRGSKTETYEERRRLEKDRVKAVERADSAWFKTHGPLLKRDTARELLMRKPAFTH